MGGAQRRGAETWLAALAVVAVAVALRAPVADLPLERDEGEYAYIAQRWLAGELPYRDAFDQKPPAIFGLYALGLALGGESPAALRWTGQIATLGTLLAVGLVGRRLFSPGIGVAAALLTLLLTADPSWLGNSFNTEHLAILPLTFAAAVALGSRRERWLGPALATGLLGGLAFVTKPVTLPVALFAMGTAAWLARRLVGPPLAAAAGFALGLAPIALYFAAHGAWSELLDATLLHNLYYAGSTPLADYPIYFWASFRGMLAPLAPVFLAAGLGVLSLGLARRPDVDVASTRRRLAWCVTWLGVSFLGVVTGGYFRQHYFVLAAPPLALLAAVGLDEVLRRVPGVMRAGPWAVPAAALVLVGWAVCQNWWYFGPSTPESKLHRIYGSNPFPEAQTLARWLARRSTPEDEVFVYGSEPELLFHAQRRSASRYIFAYPLLMPLPGAQERQREALAELQAAPPRFIVASFVQSSTLEQDGTPPDLKQGLRALIDADYRLAAVLPYARDRRGAVMEGDPAQALWKNAPLWDGATPWAAFVVWERRRAAPPAPSAVTP